MNPTFHNLSPQEIFSQAIEFQQAGRHFEAVEWFDALIDMTPNATSDELSSFRFTSSWNALKMSQDSSYWRHYDRMQRLAHNVGAHQHWFVGEIILASPQFTNLSQLRNTQLHAQYVLDEVTEYPEKPFELSAPKPGKKIKLGFVGSDFFSQATAYLLTAAIGAINREQFEVFAYDHGDIETIRENDSFRARAYQAYDHITPIQDMTDLEAAQRIHADGIDVLFCIKNPASARLGVFALRPAAIQIFYLYFPGTSGMPFFDYMIGDHVVTPPELDYGYSEKILRMDGCYQPNDDRRETPADVSRSNWGVPEDAVVLANMSQNYKITPQMFDVWCRLLHQDEKRVLWLLSDDEQVKANLVREAVVRGVSADRIFFSQPSGLGEHYARLRCADLIVDTYPYGGHTLTSDALWSGTPVVTLAGTTFASRVASSLLVSVGLAELVALHEDEYFLKADAVARSADVRKQYRQHLDKGRHTFDLFSSTSYARRFEKLIKETIASHWAS